MTDLRTRIAAVLRSALLEINYSSAEKSADGEQWVFIDGTVMPDDLADVLIRELGLSRESMTDGISPVDDPPALHHRYVTSWVADDKPQ